MRTVTSVAHGTPNWLRLLELQSRRDFGLTLPFLVGALRTPPGALIHGDDENFREFEKLLLDMRNRMPAGYSVMIGPCSRLHQPIAHISQSPQPNYVGWPAQEQPRMSLSFSPRYVANEGLIDQAPQLMWDLCRTPIVAGNFSFDDGMYRRFTAQDIDFIARALTE